MHFAATRKGALGPRLFNTQPAELEESYANFAIAESPLKLVLIENLGHGGAQPAIRR